ncbi:hypothetical protein, partial [Streptomyces sp. NPDC058548]
VDPRAIAEAVYEVEAPTRQQIERITDLLIRNGLIDGTAVPDAGELESGSDVEEENSESYVGDYEPEAPPTGASPAQLADFAIAYTMWANQKNGGYRLIDLVRTALGPHKTPEDGHKNFFSGVEEWLGLSASQEMRGEYRREDMLKAVDLAARDLAANKPVSPYVYVREVWGTSRRYLHRVARVRGWAAASGALGQFPAGGALQKMIDRALHLAEGMRASRSGVVDVAYIARKVFRRREETVQQRHLITMWLGEGDDLAGRFAHMPMDTPMDEALDDAPSDDSMDVEMEGSPDGTGSSSAEAGRYDLPTLAANAEFMAYGGKTLAEVAQELSYNLPFTAGDPQGYAHRLMLEHAPQYRLHFEQATREILHNPLVMMNEARQLLREFAEALRLDYSVVDAWIQHHQEIAARGLGLAGLPGAEVNAMRDRAAALLSLWTGGVTLGELSASARMLRGERILRLIQAERLGGVNGEREEIARIAEEMDLPLPQRLVGGTSEWEDSEEFLRAIRGEEALLDSMEAESSQAAATRSSEEAQAPRSRPDGPGVDATLEAHVRETTADGTWAGNTAERWLLDNGTTVFASTEPTLTDDGRTELAPAGQQLTHDAVAVLRPLAVSLALIDKAWLGGVDARSLAQKLFEPENVPWGWTSVEEWLGQEGIRVLTDEERPAAEALALAGTPGYEDMSPTEVARRVLRRSGPQNGVPQSQIAGYLEAGGYPMRPGVTRAQMMVILAAITATGRVRQQITIGGIAEGVLNKKPSGTQYSRFKSWEDATRYLDSLPGRQSEYTRFVREVVDQARELRRGDGTIDVVEVAARSFATVAGAVPEVKPVHQRAAVSYWLKQAGLTELVDSAEDAGEPRSELFPYGSNRAVANAAMALTRLTPRPSRPVTNEVSSWRQRADYVVWKAAELTAQGKWFTLKEMAQLAFDKTEPSFADRLMTGAFLEIAGLGDYIVRRDNAAALMDQAFEMARRALANGTRINLSAVAGQLNGLGSKATSIVHGWFVAVGLVGGPIDPESVLGRMRSAVLNLADLDRISGREPDPADLVRYALDVPFPTAVQVAVVKEWLAEEPWKVYAAGLASRAVRDRRQLDARDIARQVLEIHVPSEEDIRLIADLLDGLRLPPEPDELSAVPDFPSPTRADRVVRDEAPAVDSYVGDREPLPIDPQASDEERADFAVEYAMWTQRVRGYTPTNDLMLAVAGKLNIGSLVLFLFGVMEGFGALGSDMMRSTATYQEMRDTVALAKTAAARGEEIVLRQYSARLWGARQGAPRANLVKGWLFAHGVLGAMPANGARKRMIDRAVELATWMLGLPGGVLDLGRIAREVFRVTAETDHQRYLIAEWLDAHGLAENSSDPEGMDVDPDAPVESGDGTGTNRAELRAAYQDVLSRYPQAPIDLAEFAAMDVRDPQLIPLEALERGLLPALAAEAEIYLDTGRSLTEAAHAILPSLRADVADPEGFTHRLLLEHRTRYRRRFEEALDAIAYAHERNVDVGSEVRSTVRNQYSDETVVEMWLRHYAEVAELRAVLEGLNDHVRQELWQQASGHLNQRIGGVRLGATSPVERLLREERLLRVARELLVRGAPAADGEAARIAEELNVQSTGLRRVGGSGHPNIAGLEETEEAGDPFSSDAAESSTAAARQALQATPSPADPLSTEEQLTQAAILDFVITGDGALQRGDLTAEEWLLLRGRPVVDQATGLLSEDAVRVLMPLARTVALHSSELAQLGAAVPEFVAALLFAPENVAQGTQLVVQWLVDAVIPVLPAELVLVATGLGIVAEELAQRGMTHFDGDPSLLRAIATRWAPGRPHDFGLLNTITGYLEAAGHDARQSGAAFRQMILSIAVLRASADREAALRDVLREFMRGDIHETARVEAWDAVTFVLDSQGMRPSPYAAFVDQVVRSAGALTGDDGTTDIRQVAILAFDVEVPSAVERAAVRYFLTEAGFAGLVDSTPSTEHRQPVVLGQRANDVGATITRLLANSDLIEPGRGREKTLRELAEYTILNAARSVARGEPLLMGDLTARTFAAYIPTNREQALVRAFLAVGGFGSNIRGASGERDDEMVKAFAAARAYLREGLPIDVTAIAATFTGDLQARRAILIGWFVAVGLMGGPIARNTVLGILRDAVRRMAAEERAAGRTPTSATIALRALDEPTSPSLPRSVIDEWLADEPDKVFAQGLARRAARENTTVSVAEIAMLVFDREPTPQETAQIVQWLDELSPGSAPTVVVESAQQPRQEDSRTAASASYVGDRLPAMLTGDDMESDWDRADYVVERYLYARAAGEAAPTMAQLGRGAFGTAPTTSQKELVAGILEWYGLSKHDTPQASADHGHMLRAVQLAKADLNLGRWIQPWRYARVISGMQPARHKSLRLRGWLIAAGVGELVSGTGARQQMIDKAVRTALDMRAVSDGPLSIDTIVRKVFRARALSVSDQQRYLITSWLAAYGVIDAGSEEDFAPGEVATGTVTGGSASAYAYTETGGDAESSAPVEVDPLLLPRVAGEAARLVSAGRSLSDVTEFLLPTLPVLVPDPEGYVHRLMVEHDLVYRHHFERALEELANPVGTTSVSSRVHAVADNAGLHSSIADMWGRHADELAMQRARLSAIQPQRANQLRMNAAAHLNARIGSVRLTPRSTAENMLHEERILRVALIEEREGELRGVAEADAIGQEMNVPDRGRLIGGSGTSEAYQQYLQALAEDQEFMDSAPAESSAQAAAAASDQAMDTQEGTVVTPGLTGPEWQEQYDLFTYVAMPGEDGLPTGNTAEGWLTERGRTVWQGGTLSDDAARVLHLLTGALSQRDVEQLGAADAEGIAAKVFLAGNLLEGRPLVDRWLAEWGVAVLPERFTWAARALVLAGEDPLVPANAKAIANRLYPSMENLKKKRYAEVTGFLEGAGRRVRARMKAGQMVVSVAAMLAASYSIEPLSLSSIVEDVLRKPSGSELLARVRAWQDVTEYVENVLREQSVYSRFVETALTAAQRQLRETGSIDVAQVAELVFSDELDGRPSAEQRAAVRFWLEQSGLRDLLDSVDGATPQPVRTFPPRNTQIAHQILKLAAGVRPQRYPQRDTPNFWAEVADYTVWAAAERVVDHKRLSVVEIALVTSEDPGHHEWALVAAFLEVGGFGAAVRRTTINTDSALPAVLAEARKDASEGALLDPKSLASRVLKDISQNARWTVEGWLRGVGFGTPLNPNGVLALLRSTVHGLAARDRAMGREPDAARLVTRILGAQSPTASMIAVFQHWILEGLADAVARTRQEGPASAGPAVGDDSVAEDRLVANGIPVWDPQTGVLLAQAAEALQPLAHTLAVEDTALKGGVDAKGTAARLFRPERVPAALPVVERWLTESGFRLLTAVETAVTRALALAKTEGTDALGSLASAVHPEMTDVLASARVDGYLEAAGYPMRDGANRKQMMVALAALEAAPESVHTDRARNFARDVLKSPALTMRQDTERVLGWRDATRSLDALSGRPSAYAGFVTTTVALARTLRKDDGATDVAEVAAVTFSEGSLRRPSPEERAAVRFWLERAGIEGLVDSAAGPLPQWTPSFHMTPGSGIVAKIVELGGQGTERPSRPDTTSTDWAAWADYTVWKAAELISQGTPLTLDSLTDLVFGRGRSSVADQARVMGALSASGLGAFLEGRTGEAYLPSAFDEARKDLREGKRIVHSSIIERLRHGTDRSLAAVVTTWFAAVGLVGGPLAPDGPLGRLRQAVRAAAEAERAAGREPDAVGLLRSVLGEPYPTPQQVAVVDEWLAEDPMKTFAIGFARRLLLSGEGLSVERVSKEVFGSRGASGTHERNMRQIQEWL